MAETKHNSFAVTLCKLTIPDEYENDWDAGLNMVLDQLKDRSERSYTVKKIMVGNSEAIDDGFDEFMLLKDMNYNMPEAQEINIEHSPCMRPYKRHINLILKSKNPVLSGPFLNNRGTDGKNGEVWDASLLPTQWATNMFKQSAKDKIKWGSVWINVLDGNDHIQRWSDYMKSTHKRKQDYVIHHLPLYQQRQRRKVEKEINVNDKIVWDNALSLQDKVRFMFQNTSRFQRKKDLIEFGDEVRMKTPPDTLWPLYRKRCINGELKALTFNFVPSIVGYDTKTGAMVGWRPLFTRSDVIGEADMITGEDTNGKVVEKTGVWSTCCTHKKAGLYIYGPSNCGKTYGCHLVREACTFTSAQNHQGTLSWDENLPEASFGYVDDLDRNSSSVSIRDFANPFLENSFAKAGKFKEMLRPRENANLIFIHNQSPEERFKLSQNPGEMQVFKNRLNIVNLYQCPEFYWGKRPGSAEPNYIQKEQLPVNHIDGSPAFREVVWRFMMITMKKEDFDEGNFYLIGKEAKDKIKLQEPMDFMSMMKKITPRAPMVIDHEKNQVQRFTEEIEVYSEDEDNPPSPKKQCLTPLEELINNINKQ